MFTAEINHVADHLAPTGEATALLPVQGGRAKPATAIGTEAGVAAASRYRVNHGAGRVLGRRHAARPLDPRAIDASSEDCDILTNCPQYPPDEARPRPRTSTRCSAPSTAGWPGSRPGS